MALEVPGIAKYPNYGEILNLIEYVLNEDSINVKIN